MPRKSEEQLLEQRIMHRMVKAMATYRLISDGDKILVGLSGGKDSLCLLEMLALRRKIAHPVFTVEALHVRMENIHYETDTSYLEEFAHRLGVPLHLRTTRFDSSTDTRKTPCFLCSWYRRKELFNLAQELGCNKIALGHHQDDLLHTALMSTFFQGSFATMPARLRMRKMPLSIIRPLCMVPEDDIRHLAALRGYEPQLKQCPYEHDSSRDYAAKLFKEIEAHNQEARPCLWRALEDAGKLVEE